MNYTIIGQDFYNASGYHDGEMETFYENQMNNFNKIFPHNVNAVFHYFDSAFRDESYTVDCTEYINDYIDGLAIKDGVNLVKYENGNVGFSAIYNGQKNGFEIIPLTDIQYKAFTIAENDPSYGIDYTEAEIIKQLLNATEKELIDFIAE